MRWFILLLLIVGCGAENEAATPDGGFDTACHELNYDKIGQAPDCSRDK